MSTKQLEVVLKAFWIKAESGRLEMRWKALPATEIAMQNFAAPPNSLREAA